MAKLTRERQVRERRERKQERKDARKRAATEAQFAAEAPAPETAEQDDPSLGDGGETRESMD